MKRLRLAIVHPDAWYGGGAESRPPWIIQALKDEYEVTLITAGLITSGEYEVAKINSYYGTEIDGDDFQLIHYRFPFFLNTTNRYSSLKKLLFQRFLRKELPKYDLALCTSSFAPVDLGVPAIRFVVAFDFDRALCDKLEPPPQYRNQTFRKSSQWLQNVYLMLLRALFPTDIAAWRKDLVVSNSNWTGEILLNYYGAASKTLYPPVWASPPQVPFAQREIGFVWVGVFAPQKEVESAIEILNEVRKKGHNIHLHIIGWGYSEEYTRIVEELQKRHSDWVFLEGKCGMEKKYKLISEHRYGINSRVKEPFGIVVAEMMKSGCIVFCPNDGGQVEIAADARLAFNSREDAVAKICAVLDSSELQNELVTKLIKRSECFSVDAFQRGVRKIVEDFLKSAPQR